MSIHAVSTVFYADVKPHLKLLLLALADNAHEDGRGAFPSIALLTRKTSLSERSVQRFLKELRDDGLIVIEREATQTRPREYRIMLTGLDEIPVPSKAKGCPPALRQEVIEQFQQTCQYCHERGTVDAGPDGDRWNVDRMVPGSRGGEYDPENITLACASCNRKKRTQDAGPDIISLAMLCGGVPDLAPLSSGVPVAARQGRHSRQTGAPLLAPDPSEEPSIEPSVTSQGLTATGLQAIWNQHRGTLPTSRSLTLKMRRDANRRLVEQPKAEIWITVVQKMAASKVCAGAPWATFRHLIKPDTWAKAIDGAYDWDPANRQPKTSGSVREQVRSANVKQVASQGIYIPPDDDEPPREASGVAH